MAKVVIQRVWPDVDCLTVSITAKESYPQVMRETVRAALDAYQEALAITIGDSEGVE